MIDIAALIRSAVMSAREINRMIVAEHRSARDFAKKEARLDCVIGSDELREWKHRNEAVCWLQEARDDCMYVARNLSRVSNVRAKRGPTA